MCKHWAMLRVARALTTRLRSGAAWKADADEQTSAKRAKDFILIRKSQPEAILVF